MSVMLCHNAGRACLVIGVLVLVVSVCTAMMWRWSMKLQLDWGMKRLFLMQWPRLLSGLGVIALLFGIVGGVGQIAQMFFRGGCTATQTVHFRRCLRALVPIFWGGMFFAVAWIQFGFYRFLVGRCERRQADERGDDRVES